MENRDTEILIDLEEYRSLSINNEKLELLIKAIEDTSFLSYNNKDLDIDSDDIKTTLKILFPDKYQKIINAKQYRNSVKEKEK